MMTAVDGDTRRRDTVASLLEDVRGSSDNMICFFDVKSAHLIGEGRYSRGFRAETVHCVSGIDRSQTP